MNHRSLCLHKLHVYDGYDSSSKLSWWDFIILPIWCKPNDKKFSFYKELATFRRDALKLLVSKIPLLSIYLTLYLFTSEEIIFGYYHFAFAVILKHLNVCLSCIEYRSLPETQVLHRLLLFHPFVKGILPFFRCNINTWNLMITSLEQFVTLNIPSLCHGNTESLRLFVELSIVLNAMIFECPQDLMIADDIQARVIGIARTLLDQHHPSLIVSQNGLRQILQKHAPYLKILAEPYSSANGELRAQLYPSFIRLIRKSHIRCQNHKCRVYFRSKKTAYKHRAEANYAVEFDYFVSKRVRRIKNTKSLRSVKLSGDRRKIRANHGHPIRWQKCKRCKLAYYCSKKCQKVDWNKYHKVHCRQIESGVPNLMRVMRY